MSTRLREIALREWKKSDFAVIQRETQRVAAMAKQSGTQSDKFQSVCKQMLGMVTSAGGRELPGAIRSPIDVRAFTFLLANVEGFKKRVLVDKRILDALQAPSLKMGSISLMQLIRAFFMYFDQLGSDDSFNLLTQLIREQLAKRDFKAGASDLGSLSSHRTMLFNQAGPRSIVDISIAESVDLDVVFKRYALDGYADGRFQKLARYRYYIRQLEDLPPGKSHRILKEVIREEVYMAPGDGGRLLGHSVLEILIDRTPGNELSDAWRHVILTIANDPRVSSTSEHYQRWWMPLGEARISRMRGWLSRFDLRLFLQVLANTAQESGDERQINMYKTRKKFMEGLLELELVQNSRLLLGQRAAWNLRKNFKSEELPTYAELNASDTSILYLDVKGIHMIEGTHNFKVKVMDKVPKNLPVLDYNRNHFDDWVFRTNVKNLYEEEHSNKQDYWDNPEFYFLEKTHDVHLNWQYDLIEYFRNHKIIIPPRRVIRREQYKVYREKFGIAI